LRLILDEYRDDYNTHPHTDTNLPGCYYVRIGEGYCPSAGTYIPMQDPNQ
jgi:hypothetical protein